MRILLTGRTGQVGRELERALAPLGALVATDRASLDLADRDSIRRVVRDVKPEVIVNAAAYTAVDRAESEPGLAMRVNGEAPGILSDEAKRLGAMLVHFSTDYVFDGEKAAPYVEPDPTTPVNAYGRSKLAGEQAIRASGARHLILRLAWVYGPRGRNFFLTIAGRASSGEPLRVVDDQSGTPTESRFAAEATARALACSEVPEGLFHLAPRGQTTWCGFARAIVGRLRSASVVTGIPSVEYPTPARRPKCSVLDATAIEAAIGLERPTWESLLDRCVADYATATAAQ